MTYAETDLVATIEQLAGQRLDSFTSAQLDAIDQFHSGGAEAVDRILPSLAVSSGMTVLDVGSGFGGPARQIAGETGCHVVGVDITRAYVEAADALTRAAGLVDRVTFLCTDLASVDQRHFDAAYTMHVQMNVEDKKAFFGDIASRLLPGARLAAFEVCRSGDEDAALPLPWSVDGSDSFLATPASLLADIESSGFTTLEWVDDTAWVLDWFADLGERWAAAGTAALLPALLDEGPLRMMNFLDALNRGVLTVHRGSFASSPRGG